jgi:hypothetical protein
MREEENDTAVMMSLLSRCATAAEVVTLLDAVEGPHAFVYWQVRTLCVHNVPPKPYTDH